MRFDLIDFEIDYILSENVNSTVFFVHFNNLYCTRADGFSLNFMILPPSTPRKNVWCQHWSRATGARSQPVRKPYRELRAAATGASEGLALNHR